MDYRFEKQAAEVVAAIKHFAEHDDALNNFENYLSMHFDAWLERYAATPDGLAGELRDFARMFDM